MLKQYLSLADAVDASTKTTGFERNCASAIRKLVAEVEALRSAYATLDAAACADRHLAELAQDTAKRLTGEVEALQAQPEPVASLYISADGGREIDDWKCELPAGRHVLYTALAAAKGGAV